MFACSACAFDEEKRLLTISSQKLNQTRETLAEHTSAQPQIVTNHHHNKTQTLAHQRADRPPKSVLRGQRRCCLDNKTVQGRCRTSQKSLERCRRREKPELGAQALV